MKKTALLLALILCSTCFGVADANLVAYWPMDDNSVDSNFVDDTAQDNDGTFNDANTFAHSVEGKIGRAFIFNGTSDYIETHTFASVFNSAFTVTFWINAPQVDRDNYILGQYPDDGSSFNIRIGGEADSYLFLPSYESGAGGGVNASAVIPFDEWAFVAVSIYSPQENYMRLDIYINGEWMWYDLSGTGGVSGYSNSNKLLIGKAYTKYFEGSLDDFRIFKKALSSTEIQQLYYDVVGNPDKTIFGEKKSIFGEVKSIFGAVKSIFGGQ